MNSIYHTLTCVKVAQYCNTFKQLWLAQWVFVILHYKLISAQGNTITVQDKT